MISKVVYMLSFVTRGLIILSLSENLEQKYETVGMQFFLTGLFEVQKHQKYFGSKLFTSINLLVVDYVDRHPFPHIINASVKSSAEKLNTHDREYQPEHKAHQ